MQTTSIKTFRRPIVVGLLLQGDEEAFLKSCSTLAERLEAPLELVHVLEMPQTGWAAPDFIVNPFFGYERALNEMDETLARQKLEAIAQRLSTRHPVRVHVLRDCPSAALCTIATELRAGLIVCGIKAPVSEGMFRGMSTAFALASHADTAVLILPRQTFFDFSSPHRLLIADNLEIEGRFALENALRLAEDLASPAIYHVHIHKRGRQEIAGMLTHVVDEMKRSQLVGPPQLNPELYIELLSQRIRDDLIYRFHNSEGAQRLGAVYEPRVAFGDAADELRVLIEQTHAGLLVFGRHHLIHRRGFSIGKMPYAAMIKQNVATFIVPDGERHVERERERTEGPWSRQA